MLPKEEWVRLVHELCTNIAEWVESRDWTFDAHALTMEEKAVGIYTVPILVITIDDVRSVHVVPKGSDIVGADGRVDLIGHPTKEDVRLIRKDGRWVLHTSALKPWPCEWGRECFFSAIEDLLFSTPEVKGETNVTG